MLGTPSAGNSAHKDGTELRSLRLPFDLLELALRELETYGKEFLEPQCRTTLASFSERLRALGEPGRGPAAVEEACTPVRQEIPALTATEGQDATSDTPADQVMQDSTEAGGGDQNAALTRENSGVSRVPTQDLTRAPSQDKREIHKKMTQIFEKFDADHSGSVGLTELSLGLRRMGVPQAQIRAIMDAADTSGNGLVDRKEFLAASNDPQIREIFEQMAWVVAKSYPCMLSQSSLFRICWDLSSFAVLTYIAVMEPLVLAFPEIGEAKEFQVISVVIDIFWLSDVGLNFRTGYTAAEDFEIMDPWDVAKNYLQTWFFLDVISSVPFEMISGDKIDDLQPLRLLKSLKVLRALKLLKMKTTLEGLAKSEVMMDMYDVIRTSRIVNFLPLVSILGLTLLVCHWLACFMIVSGDGFLGGYQDVSGNMRAEYVSGFYWAFTTISTVGYGDITPGSTLERLYCIISMSIGGSFYGYFIARFTSIVTRSDYEKQVYTEKMGEVDIWLQHHQFPRVLRKRTRRYFERYLKTHTHVDDASILNSLSPELRRHICKHIVLTEVRDHPIFEGVPAGVMSRLAKILKRMEAQAHETLVRDGEVGSAMYIIVSGTVQVSGWESPSEAPQILVLSAGNSFGEELLVNPTGLYDYTATAQTDLSLQVLPVAGFHEEVGRFQEVFDIVRRNIESTMKRKGKHVMFRKPFETEVVDLLQNIQASQKTLKSELQNQMHARVSRMVPPPANLSDSRLGFATL